MKPKWKLWYFALLMAWLLLFAGCSGVQMAPWYATRTRMAAIHVKALNRACQAGDPNACRDGLAAANDILGQIVDALDGRAAP